jgi:RNA polymerase sigma-70 factor (ECF subfamily)
MDELPVEFREILTLRHQEDLSYKQIADIAQIPPGTVMSRLARARAKLKECLAARISKEKRSAPFSGRDALFTLPSSPNSHLC